MKLAARVVSALAFLGVVVGTSYVLRMKPIPSAPQARESVSENSVRRSPGGGRGPAYSVGPLAMEFHEPCASDNECSGNLLCLSGRCDRIDSQNRGHVGDICSGPSSGALECLSGRCEDGFCAPTLREKADNGASCSEGSPAVCRSGICRAGSCVASTIFPGLPGMECVSDADCLSSTCNAGRDGHRVCGFSSQFVATCQVVGKTVSYASECCSGQIDGRNRCAPIADSACTRAGNCAGRVGRTCADVGQLAQLPEQCCSGKALNGRCIIDNNRKLQPCNLDRACRSGLCDRKRNICDDRGQDVFSGSPSTVRKQTNPNAPTYHSIPASN